MLVVNILLPLVTTLLFETGIYMILKHRDLKLFLVVFGMNFVLNPLMNGALSRWGTGYSTYWIIVAIGEAATVFIESLIVFLFMRFKYSRILLFAFLANLLSFLVGLAINYSSLDQTGYIALTIIFVLGYLASYVFVLISFVKQNRDVES